MKTNIFKLLVISIIVSQFSFAGLYAAIDVTADNNDLFRVVISNTSQNNYEGRVAISSYTEEYVTGGARHRVETSNMQYTRDGLLESYTQAFYENDVFAEQRDFIVGVNDILNTQFRVLSWIPTGPNVLHVFLKPATATDWRVYNIVVSDLDTGEVLGVAEYSDSQCDTVAQLELINQKLDNINNNIGNSERNIINRVNTTESKLTELLKKVLQWVQAIGARLGIRRV